ncbi:tetratricopeptide repeat protein [soil metagenome]
MSPRSLSLKRDAFPVLLLFAASIILFLPSLSYALLNWDDEEYITRNAWLLNLCWRNVTGIFFHPYFNNYHPLTIISYMIDFRLWGYDPVGYRAENLLLHGATVAAMYVLMRLFHGSRAVCFLLTALFAVHPLRIESVVWISERKDVLCALFYILTLIFWARIPKWGARAITAAVACFVLAILAKPMAMTLPAVLVLHDFIFQRDQMKKRAPLLGALLLIGAADAVLNQAVQDRAIIAAFPLFERIKIALYAPIHYGIHTVWPMNISPLYPYDSRPSARLIPALAGAGVSVFLISAGVMSRRRFPLLSFGILASIIAIAPVSGIVAFGSAYAADRYSYLPTFFLLLGISEPASRWYRHQSETLRPAVMIAGGAICAICAAFTLGAMPVWENSATLWDRVLLLYPNDPTARVNRLHADLKFPEGEVSADTVSPAATAPMVGREDIANAVAVTNLQRQGRYDEALAAAKSVGEKPLSLSLQLGVFRALGDKQGDVDAARQMLALAPPAKQEYRAQAAMALALSGNDSEAEIVLNGITIPTLSGAAAWGTLAENAASRNDAAGVTHAAEKSLEIFPGEPRAVAALADVFIAAGKPADARKVLNRAARHPAAGDATKSAALSRLALLEEDLAHRENLFVEAFAIDFADEKIPRTRSEFLNYAGWQAESAHRPADADRLYTAAVEANPVNADALQNLALIKEAQGKREEALALLTRAAAAAPDDEAIRHNLETMKSHAAKN